MAAVLPCMLTTVFHFREPRSLEPGGFPCKQPSRMGRLKWQFKEPVLSALSSAVHLLQS